MYATLFCRGNLGRQHSQCLSAEAARPLLQRSHVLESLLASLDLMRTHAVAPGEAAL